MAIRIQRTGAGVQRLVFCIVGPSGVGKTRFAATFKNPLVLNLEAGVGSLDDGIPYTDIKTITELREVKKGLELPGKERADLFGVRVDTVVVDTLDEVQKILVDERKALRNRENFDQQDWGWLADQTRAIIRGFRNLTDMNVIFTLHTKESRDEESGRVYFRPMLQGAVADELSQYMDITALIRTQPYMDNGTRKIRRVLQAYPDERYDWLKDRKALLPMDFEVNLQDDYSRIASIIWSTRTQEIDALIGADEPASAPAEEKESESAPEAVVASTSSAEEPTQTPQEPTKDEAVAQPVAPEPDPEPEPEPQPAAASTEDTIQDVKLSNGETTKMKVPAGVNPDEPPPGRRPRKSKAEIAKELAAALEAPASAVAVADPPTENGTWRFTCEDCKKGFDDGDDAEISNWRAKKVLCAQCFRAWRRAQS